MPDVIEYPLSDGGTLLVAVEHTGEPAAVTRGGWGQDRTAQVAERANETFEAAVDKVRPAADALLTSLKGMAATPSEITVEFAVQLNAAAGICIATLGSSANFKVGLKWTAH